MLKDILWTSVLCIAAAHSASADQWSKHFNTGATPELFVHTTDANITILGGSGSEIEAQVTTSGWRIAPGEITISERQSGNRVELDVTFPKMHFNLDFGHRWVKVDLHVPSGTQADIHTGDGSIRTEGLRGGKLETHDGSIDGHGFDGMLDARSGDGSIRVNGKFAGLNLSSGDGSIVAEVAPGSHMANGWTVHSGDGRVTLRLPDGFAANLEAHTGDGHIHVNLPMATAENQESSFNGKLNGGGPVLSIHTGDGSIDVTRL